jgi:hypothetical protein
MIRLERSPQFWFNIAVDPAVTANMPELDAAFVAQHVGNPLVFPWASENGGYLLTKYDALGSMMGLHALYRPAGWGREAHDALGETLQWAFRTCQLVTAHETVSNPHSRTPKSFGFIHAADWQDSLMGEYRLMILTRAAWEMSPAHRRLVVVN